MHPAQSTTHQKLLELLHLTPEAHMREGYVMALRNAVDEYVHSILRESDEAGESRSSDLD